MQCKKVRRLFGPYLDGELTFEQEESFDAHIEGCASCGKEYGKLRRTRDLLRSLPREDPGEEFTRTVLARMRELAGEAAGAESVPLWERIRSYLDPRFLLRPAVGMAMALVLGLAAGAAINRLAAPGLPGGETPTMAQRQTLDTSPPSMPSPGTHPVRVGDRFVGAEGAGTVSLSPDSTGIPPVEFVLEPYIVGEGPEQVAVPLFPTGRTVSRDGSRDDVYITF